MPGSGTVARARAWYAGHRKLIAAVAGTFITFAVQMGWEGNPYVALAIGLAASAGVYRLRNEDAVPAPVPGAGTGPAAPPQAPVTPAPAASFQENPAPPAAGAGSPRIVAVPRPPDRPA